MLIFCPKCCIWHVNIEEQNQDILFNMFDDNVETIDLTENEINELLSTKPQGLQGWKRIEENGIWYFEKKEKPINEVKNLRWDYVAEDWCWDSVTYQTFK